MAKAIEDVKMPEPERPALVAVREFENVALPTPIASDALPVDVESEPPALPSPAPQLTVGAFQTVASIARRPGPERPLAPTNFDGVVLPVPQSNLGQAAVGAFDVAPTSKPTTQQSRVIREGGFGASESRELPNSQDRRVIQQAGFSDTKAVEPVHRSAATPRTPSVLPVQVLSKPTPIYTDEARRLKVEGAVVLEVEFCASGVVRVVRVVQGLGHGLDESATIAAKSIQFKPAVSEGRPVDYRATVQIVFRLA